MRASRVTCAILSALILTLSAATVVCAAVSGPFTTSTPIPYTKTDWAGTLAFPKFDPSLGTLTQVDISITSVMRTVLTVTNTGDAPSSGMAKTQVTVTVTDPLSLITMGPDFFSPNFPFSLDPGQFVTSGQLIKSAVDVQSFFDVFTLGEFTGPGTIVLNAETYTQTWLAYNGGNTDASQVTDASCTGTVTYYYDEVIPEPASMTILGTAFLGLMTMIKRRR